MHLLNANRIRIDNTLEVLKEYEVQKIVPLHCTGGEAASVFSRAEKWEVISEDEAKSELPRIAYWLTIPRQRSTASIFENTLARTRSGDV